MSQSRFTPAVIPHLELLTPREREILHLRLHAWSNKAVAHLLGISTKTVKNHMTRLLARLEQPCIASVAALYFECGDEECHFRHADQPVCANHESHA